MHRIFYLAKILRKSGSGDDVTGKGRKSTETAWGIMGIIASLGLIALGLFAGKFSFFLEDPVVFMKILFFAGGVIGIILSLPGFINNLYMADDLQVLLTFPYKPTEITAAKIINSCNVILGSVIVTTLPFQITYGIVGHMPLSYFIAVLCALICIPLIVISFVSIVLMIIIFFVKNLKNRDTLKITGGILAFAFIVVVMLVLYGGDNNSERMTAILEAVGNISNILPINFALEIIINRISIVAIIEVLVITAAFVAVFLFCAAKIYIPGALSIQETSAGGKSLDDTRLAKTSIQKSQFKAYFVKELRHIKREPAYLMTGWLYTIFFPAVMLFIYMFGFSKTEFLKLSSITDNPSVVGWCTGVVIFITFIACSANAISCSSISREGKDIMILKQTPIDYKTVLKAKMGVSAFVCSLGSTSYVIIGGIVLAVLGYVPVWAVLYALVLNVCIIFFAVCMCMMHDIKKPSFTWETEAEMVKKCVGGSSVAMMIIGVFVGMFMAGILKIVGKYFWAAMIFFVLLCAALAFIEVKRLYKTGVAKMMDY